MKKLSVLNLLSILAIIALASCNDDPPGFRFDFDDVPAAFDTTGKTKTILEPAFYYFDIETGTGTSVATPVDVVRLHYTLRIKKTGKVISSTYVNGELDAPSFALGQRLDAYNYTGFSTGDFLGLRRSVAGMKPGGKRTVLVPPEYAFGYNLPFILDIELISIIQ